MKSEFHKEMMRYGWRLEIFDEEVHVVEYQLSFLALKCIERMSVEFIEEEDGRLAYHLTQRAIERFVNDLLNFMYGKSIKKN